MMRNEYEQQRLHYMAIALLEQLQITPSESQIELVAQALAEPELCSKQIMREPLTTQQQACLIWAARGLTAKETADNMQLEVSTITTHRNAAMKKLNCKTIVQAVCKAMQTGLINVEEVRP